jgi:hypothetical protein
MVPPRKWPESTLSDRSRREKRKRHRRLLLSLLFMRVFVGGRRVLVSLLAMFVSCVGVLFRLFVFAQIMMMGSLVSFARINDKLMTASCNCDFSDSPHCVSFDFAPTLLDQILSGLPAPLAEQFRDALSRAPFQASAENTIEVDIDTTIGVEIDNGSEKFIPLIIENVLASRFNHSPITAEATDIPDHIFRLRRAYKIR